MVNGTTSMGMQAVILAFGVPFLVLFIALYATIRITGNELTAAVAGLLALVPYYLIIYMCRKKLSRKFFFTIEPINN